MNEKAFIKTTGSGLSGAEKAAILIAELGPSFVSSYDQLYALHLTKDEISKIKKAMKKIGPYNPGKMTDAVGIGQIKREQEVLREALAFFRAKRGVSQTVAVKSGETMSPSGTTDQTLKQMDFLKIKDSVFQKPDDVANILRVWLDGEEKERE